MLPHCKSHHYFSVTSLNIPIFFCICKILVCVCMKSKAAWGRAGEAKCSSSQRLITWFCFCVQRQPCQSDPNAKTLLNCLHADSPSTVSQQQLWATSIPSFLLFFTVNSADERRVPGTAERHPHAQILQNEERKMSDEALLWRSCGRGHQVQVIIRVKVLALPGCCELQTVIGSTSCAACLNEKLQDLDLTNFFYAHDDFWARPAAA